MKWDKLIKDLREKMILSQEEFAHKLGVAFCTVNRYEKGHYEPSFKIQRKLKALALANKFDFESYRK